MEICETLGVPTLWYRIFTKAMVIVKGSYVYGELKNVMVCSVQKTYLPVRDHKVPHFMGGSTGPRIEVCEISGLPIPMVQHLHQSNGYINRKLRIWRGQKCDALVGAESVHTSTGLQTTPFYGGHYRDQNGNMRNFSLTNLLVLVGAETVLTSAGP